MPDGAPVTVPGPAGPLEGRWHEPDGPPRGVAVVAHPQPMMGGTMASPVVVRCARALAGAGVAALRFNFRGVGASGGTHSGGAQESHDVGAAIAWVRERCPGLPCLASGYSFGGMMVGRLAPTDARVDAVAIIGFPLTMGQPLPDCGSRPLLVIQGELDRFGNGAAIATALEASGAPNARLRIIPGAEHLFPRQSQDVADALVEALGWLYSF